MQQTKTTMRLTMPARPRFDGLPLPVAIAVVVFALLGIAAAVGRIASAPAAAVQPTAGLIILIATPQSQAVPLAAPAPVQQVAAAPAGNVTKRAIVAYSAPDLASAIGAVEPGRAFTPIAWNGPEWMQVDMQGSGLVFVRVADLYDLPAGLVDLKPAAPAPQIVNGPVYIEQPAAPQAPVVVEQPYQVSNDQPPPPAQPPERPAQPAAAPIVAPAPAQQAQPTALPAPQPPSQPSDVERAWVQEELRWEHPEWATPYPLAKP